jgi:hypothetical protein
VSGAALMIRRQLIEQIGVFDEDFFMYCEDVDLCWRANHAPHPDLSGQTWRVAYDPDSIIYHLIGKSSDQVPTRMTWEFHRSQYLFYKKHYAATTFLLLRPIIPAGIAARAAGGLPPRTRIDVGLSAGSNITNLLCAATLAIAFHSPHAFGSRR